MKSKEFNHYFLYTNDDDEKLDSLVCLQVNDPGGKGSSKLLAHEETEAKRFASKGRPFLSVNNTIKFNGCIVKFMDLRLMKFNGPSLLGCPIQRLDDLLSLLCLIGDRSLTSVHVPVLM